MRVSSFSFFVMLCVTAILPLPAQETGTSSQAGFGLQADIFKRVQSSVSQSDYSRNLSVMNSYILTPGDLFELTVGMPGSSGTSLSTFPVQLQEDYTLEMPFIGKTNAKGMSLLQLQNHVTGRIKSSMPVQYISFLLKAPAQFNVFVYGGVMQPGYITASSLVRLIDAVAAAGGFKENGSYRTIRLMRNGSAQTVDIARFYAEADESSNPFLKPGDSVYVPYAQIVAAVSGKVKFPGTYELLPGENLDTLIKLAGGFTPEARTDPVEITQVAQGGRAVVRAVRRDAFSSTELSNGDVVTVRSIYDNADTVAVEGAVYGKRISAVEPLSAPVEPVRVELPYYPGMTILSALDAVGGLTPFAEAEKTLLKRKSDGREESLDINTLWKTRSHALDTELFPGDHLVVPVSKRLVFVTGEVYNPGPIKFVSGYNVNYYILQAGGVIDNIGNPDGVYIVNEAGKRTRVKQTAEAAPGMNIHVEKKLLFRTNQLFQNMLIVTGFMTALIFTNDTFFDFWDRIKRRF